MSPLELKRTAPPSKLITGSLVGSFGFYFMTTTIMQHIASHPRDPGTRWLAALPVVILLLVLMLAKRGLRRMDELERRMHLEAMAYAFPGGLLLVMTYVCLTVTDFELPPIFFLVPAMVGVWLVSLILAVERYK